MATFTTLVRGISGPNSIQIKVIDVLENRASVDLCPAQGMELSVSLGRNGNVIGTEFTINPPVKEIDYDSDQEPTDESQPRDPG